MGRRFVVPAGALEPGPSSDDRAGVDVELGAEVARHLEVLRLEVGTEIELTDGEGWEAEARIQRLGKRGAGVRLLGRRRRPPDDPPEIVLLQGIGKGDKLEHVARAAAELGASRLVPVLTARAVAQRGGKIDRLRAIAEDGLRVAGGAWRMKVDDPMPLEAALEIDADLRLGLVVGAERGLRAALEARRPPPVRLALLVGPEGGFSQAERARIGGLPFSHAVSLGPRILRADTAAVAAVFQDGSDGS